MGSKSSPGRDSASSGSWKLLGLLGLAALVFVAFTPAAAPPEVDDPSERRDPRAAVRRDIPAAHSLRGRADADVAVPPPDVAAAAMASAAASELPQTDLHALGYAASAGERFLAAMRERDGVVVLPSGLQYKVLRRGSGGFHPTVSSKCSCHYEGRLVDGAKFDSSYDRRAPTSFAPNQVIKGWTEAMQLMVEGDKWEMYIPADLAYGKRGRPPKIPANAVLVFVMEIVKIQGAKVPAAPPPAAASPDWSPPAGGAATVPVQFSGGFGN